MATVAEHYYCTCKGSSIPRPLTVHKRIDWLNIAKFQPTLHSLQADLSLESKIKLNDFYSFSLNPYTSVVIH